MRTVLLALIGLYQRRFAAPFAGACRFEPSCSEYARRAVMAHGAWLGAALALARLLRCRPHCASGTDPVPGRGQVLRSLRGALVSTR